MRTSIRQILESSSEIVVIGEADNGRIAVEMVRKLRPDVLILDLELPELSGVRVMQQIQGSYLPVQVVVLSSYDDAGLINVMLDAGAADYLTKQDAPERLVEVVQEVAHGIATDWAPTRHYQPHTLPIAARQTPNVRVYASL
jgi:DNA-binding NarL/FixJ family response regulator